MPCENATKAPQILERSSSEATFCLQYIPYCVHTLFDEHFT